MTQQTTGWDEHRKALRIAQLFFQDQLATSAQAQDYVRQRAIPPETLKHYGVGFAPDEWRQLGNHYTTRTMANAALEAGLLQQGQRGRPYDFFRGRLMFPIQDLDGNTVAFGGRSIPGMSSTQPREQDGQIPAKYLNSKDSAHFHKGALLFGASQGVKAIFGQGSAIVVEGYMDVLRLHASGVSNAVAPLGTAFTVGQMRQLCKMGAQTVYFCFDGDSAGQKASLSAALIALEGAAPWTDIRFVQLDNADPDEFVREHGADAFAQRLEQAMPLATLLDNSFWPTDEQPSLEQQASYMSQMAEYIAAAGGEQRNKLIEHVQLRVGLPHVSHQGERIEYQPAGYISDNHIALARMLMHQQVGEDDAKQLVGLVPELGTSLADANSDIAFLARTLGPLPEQDIELAVQEAAQNASEEALSRALAQAQAMSFDRGLKNEVKALVQLRQHATGHPTP